MIQVAVWNVPKQWRQSKYSGAQTKKVSLKGLDDSKTYYLNLNTTYQASMNMEPYCEEGNILSITLQANGKNVNYFQPWSLLKKVGKQSDEKKDNIRTVQYNKKINEDRRQSQYSQEIQNLNFNI